MTALLLTCMTMLSQWLPTGTEHFKQMVVLSAIESACNPTAVSSAGARGLTQIMPLTGQMLWHDCGMLGEYDELSLHNPAVSIALSHCYLRRLQRRWGSTAAALAAYHGGTAAGKAVVRGKGLRAITGMYVTKYHHLLEVLNEVSTHSTPTSGSNSTGTP